MKIKNSIKNIRKNSLENWNHYKFEDYNGCPFCNGKIHMTGSVSEYQNYKCYKCGKTFTLNAFTEEIDIDDVKDANIDDERIYILEYEVDNGVTYIEDIAFIKSSSMTYAKLLLKNYICNIHNDYRVSKISGIGIIYDNDIKIITGKFGYD